MRVSHSKAMFVAAAVGCGVLFVCVAVLSGPAFYPRWRSVTDGMSETEVKQLLGTPISTGKGECTGAGGKTVTRWTYRIELVGRRVDYYVDFDYIGPGGAPAVFRTERVCQDWFR